MEKITLTFVGRYSTKKDGTPLVSAKTGKPYTSLRIKANEYGDKYLSGFDGAETQGWKEGDTVEVEVEQKGEYLNFSVPKRERSGGIPEEKMVRLMIACGDIAAIRRGQIELYNALMEAGVIKRPAQNIPGTTVGYPEGPEGPTAFDEGYEQLARQSGY